MCPKAARPGQAIFAVARLCARAGDVLARMVDHQSNRQSVAGDAFATLVMSPRIDGDLSATATAMRPQERRACVLFDHLVGAAEQRCWHVKPERLGNLHID